jgi:hypothetical protein
LTISEKRTGAKNILNESVLQFFEIPSRKSFPSSSISSFEIFQLEWHKSNSILAVLCKSAEKNPKWSIRIFEFAQSSYRMAHTNLSDNIQYYTITIKFIGNDLFVVPKFKEGSLDTMNVFPYKLDRSTLKIEPWSSDKYLKNMRHTHFIPSSNGVHFILANLDTNNTNAYGKVDLYAIFDNAINFCRNYEFGGNLESIKWDHGGRLFLVELNRKNVEGVRFFDTEGFLSEYKDNTFQNVSWRPRHIPILNKAAEEEDIKKNFKSIARVFEEEDSEFLSVIEKQKREEMKKIRERFMNVVNRRREQWEASKEDRDKLYIEPKEELVEAEYISEEILQTVEEVLKSD